MELSYCLWNQTKLNAGPNLPRLILLHGMGGTGALWRPHAATLETQMAILAPDQRGHGKSQNQELTSYQPLDYGTDVVELIRKLDFTPTWVLGHSMGVRTAVAMASLVPEAISGLILVDLGLSPGPAGGGLGKGLSSFLEKLPTRFESRDVAKAFMVAHCPDPSIALYLMAVSVREASGQVSFPFDHRALIQTIEAAHLFPMREKLAEFGRTQKPVIFLRGAQSLVWSHEEFEEERQRFSEFSQFQWIEVSGAGHGLPFEKRQGLVDLIQKNVLLNYLK